MPIARLSGRALLRISGPDAEHFLQNLVTTDLDRLEPGQARPSALLSPQGKVMFDFLISRSDDGFVIDVPEALAADLAKRLTMYKLRAKVAIAEAEESVVAVSWDADSSGDGWLADARFPTDARVARRYQDVVDADASAADWHRLRIAQGVAESGSDFVAGDAFPHDILYDFNGGVGFKKGCFVGQEVVSRMQHRGTARRRVLTVEGSTILPDAGSTIEADGRAIGTLGTVDGQRGLAILRIDRAKAAMDKGVAIKVGDAELALTIPAWAGFGFPEAASEQDEG